MARHVHPKIVIVGAGFAGLWAAKALNKANSDVSVIDRNNFHTFFPLLYQVGAGELEPEQIAYPVRTILRNNRNTRFIYSNVQKVDIQARNVYLENAVVPFDYLILATGSAPTHFGIAGALENTLPLRTLDDGVSVRNQILTRFEEASLETDPEKRKALLTITIIGGGPTGVEFAGSLVELTNGPLRKDYPQIDFGEVKVVVIEARERVLATMPEKFGKYASEHLRKKGVHLMLQDKAASITPEAVSLASGGVINTRTVVWTAGVKGNPVAEIDGVQPNKRGQIDVTPALNLAGHPNVYVAGDLAAVAGPAGPYPMVATTAMQQGTAAARNILRQLEGKEPVPFSYKDLGMLAIVGRGSAVADIGRLKFTGPTAWFLWLGLHIYKLIGFRNRLQVLIDWAWSYIFFERAIRLIFYGRTESPDGKPKRP